MRVYFFAFLSLFFFYSQNTFSQIDVSINAQSEVIKGGITFDLTLNQNLPEENNFISISVKNSKTSFYPDYWGSQYELACSMECSLFVSGAYESDYYELDIYIHATDQNISKKITFNQGFFPWWKNNEILNFKKDIFTGFSTFDIVFKNVPLNVNSFQLAGYYDSSYNGFPSDLLQTYLCEKTSHQTFTCPIKIRPLCVQDDFSSNSQYCEEDPNTVFFQVNDRLDTGISKLSILYRLSRYQEGVLMAKELLLSKGFLQSQINLDTFLLKDFYQCSETNLSFCYDVAMYYTFINDYVQSFNDLLNQEGLFQVVVENDTIKVNMKIPQFPIGEHGLKAKIVLINNLNLASKELKLDCDQVTCKQLIIPNLVEGEYRIKLQLFNNHPLVNIYDINYNEIMFGQNSLLEMSYPQTISIKKKIRPFQKRRIPICIKRVRKNRVRYITKRIHFKNLHKFLARGASIGRCHKKKWRK